MGMTYVSSIWVVLEAVEVLIRRHAVVPEEVFGFLVSDMIRHLVTW
jgi:hypothetical protein